MLPSIFGESLFDDWFDFPFRGFESDVDQLPDHHREQRR